ncbi:MAG: TIGR03790 family protein [Lentisphaerae bacterium]|nr:TIGR03790 family protein [Lentisphaerota bacterium]
MYVQFERVKRFLTATAAALTALSAQALGPHEILLLVNRASKDSETVASEYARMRGVPQVNIVRLDIGLPEHARAMTPDAFRSSVWEPAAREAERRGVGKQILAWVYSCGFPMLISTPTPVSITGMTFARCVLPEEDRIRKGTFNSPIFAGPHRQGIRGQSPQTFDTCAEWLRDDMPLPAMMLGVTGKHGNTVNEILGCLRAGKRSDSTHPAGTVYFHERDDVRSKCRAWQFGEAAAELRHMNSGMSAVITGSFPVMAQDVIGYMTGAPVVEMDSRVRPLPGAMMEHLTSLAADYSGPHQTKISEWIRLGATLTAGTVCEPYSIWAKFPSARFFPLYASGCTAIESFYQSVLCPLQILPVGDPLASPYGSRASVEFTSWPPDSAWRGRVRVAAAVKTDGIEHFSRMSFYVDGLPAGHGNEIEFDSDTLPPGEHRLRCVARTSGLVRRQVYAERVFVSGRHGTGNSATGGI